MGVVLASFPLALLLVAAVAVPAGHPGRALGLPAGYSGLWVAALWAGSLLGGLAYGRFRVTADAATRLSWATGGLALSLAVCAVAASTGSLLWFALAAPFSAVSCAPMIAAFGERAGQVAPEGRRASMFMWLSGANALGLALGSGLSGALLTAGGVAGMLAAGSMVVGGAAVTVLRPSRARVTNRE